MRSGVSKDKTQFRPIPIMRPSLPPMKDYVEKVKEIWDSRMLSNFGKFSSELEQKSQNYLGNKNVRAVSSCDTGLILGLAALELPKGSECIVTPFTFNSTINAVVWNGLVPRFADIDPLTFNISPDEVEDSINRRTKAILATHVFGNPCNISRLRRIAEEHDLHLVFDAAHAYGSEYKGKKIGTFGEIETFSLSGTKLVTGGEGGLVAAGNADITRKLELFRNYGFYGDYNSLYVGLNGKMSELNAALACLTIDTIQSAVKRRNGIVRIYREELEGIGGLEFQLVDRQSRCAYKDFGLRIRNKRNRVEKELSRRRIQTKRYFLPAHTMPAYSGFPRGPLPQVEKLYAEILCVPIFNEMDDDAVRRVCQAVRAPLK